MAIKKTGEPRVVGVDTGTTVLIKWVLSKVKADEAKAEQAKIRPRLVSMFDDEEPDNDGHRYIPLPEPVEGFTRIQYQRRASNVADIPVILEVLERYGLLDSCTDVARVPNEEAIMNAIYDGKMPEAELESMYKQKVIYAVVCQRG